jgi:hypothetical protein
MTRQATRRTLASWSLLVVAVFTIALVGWVAVQAVRQHFPSNPLGPMGGSSIAQDVDSLVGQKAPVFSLRDPQGEMHTVVPGQGRPIVLIFHMGLH